MKKKPEVIISETDLENRFEIPEDWKWSTISECFSEIINGTTAQQNKEGNGIPVSRIETIQNAKFDLNRIQYIQNPSPEFIQKYKYRIGDIALSHINSLEHVGKTALYLGKPEVFLHGMNLLRLRISRPDLFPNFAYYFMQMSFFRDEVRNRVGKAVNQVSINQKNLSTIPFLLPPFPEQQHIVARVEALLANVNAARERLQRVPLIMKKFRQAVLAAACEGRLTEGWRDSNSIDNINDSFQNGEINFDDETNTPYFIGLLPESWGWISVDDVMDKVIDYRGRTPPIDREGIPHITTSNIRNGCISWTTEKFVTQETYDNYMTRGIPEIGDVFFTMEGPLGEVAVLHENRKFSLAQRLLLLRGEKKILNSEYLAFALMCPGVQSAINMKATGSGVKGIAYKRFKFVQLPLPPLAEQHEIVRRVEALFARADAVEREVAAATKRADALTQAVLAKAFAGRL